MQLLSKGKYISLVSFIAGLPAQLDRVRDVWHETDEISISLEIAHTHETLPVDWVGNLVASRIAYEKEGIAKDLQIFALLPEDLMAQAHVILRVKHAGYSPSHVFRIYVLDFFDD